MDLDITGTESKIGLGKGLKIESKVLSAVRETHDTVTLRIASNMDFIPGQFVTLGVIIGEKEVRRSYSIANKPNGEWIEVTIKAQNPGLFSVAAQNFNQDQPVTVYGPLGKHFLLRPELAPGLISEGNAEHAGHLVLIAGGSGISAFRSFLQSVSERNDIAGRITLLYSVKTSADLIYASELEHWKQLHDVHVTLTRPTEEETTSWTGKFGRITPKLLRDTIGIDLKAKKFYICGPTPMVGDCQSLLLSLDVRAEQIVTERYGNIS